MLKKYFLSYRIYELINEIYDIEKSMKFSKGSYESMNILVEIKNQDLFRQVGRIEENEIELKVTVKNSDFDQILKFNKVLFEGQKN